MSFEQEVAEVLVNQRRRIERLEIQESPASYQAAIAQYLLLPGLVGFWPMSSVQRSTGNVYDLSGQGRTLTYNGNPTFNIYNNLVPYIDLDGTGDYFSRSDETDLDILGTESWAAVPGLTMGGWFFVGAGSAYQGLIGKWADGSNQRGYSLLSDDAATPNIYGEISSAGTSVDAGTPHVQISLSSWFFATLRFIPSTSLDVFVNTTKASDTSSIPANIFNNTAAFQIGSYNGSAQPLTGRASLCFLCANALPDAMINSLFAHTRGLFGV